MIDAAGQLLGITLDRRVHRCERQAQLFLRVPIGGECNCCADQAIYLLIRTAGKQAHILVMRERGFGERAG